MSVNGYIETNVNVDSDVFHTSGSTTLIDLEVLNSDNLPLSGCVSVETTLIKTFPENVLLNDCGCPVDECGEASLKITIRKTNPPKPDCYVDSFVLGDDGLVLFTVNGVETQYIAAECCTNLGFVSELNDKGISVCRWGEEPNICDSYIEIDRVEFYVLFTDPDGANTFEVPNMECCPSDTLPELQPNGMYMCSVPRIIEPDVCQYFRLDNIESINSYGQVAFYGDNNTLITLTNTPECCTNIGFTAEEIPLNPGTYTCKRECQEYSSYEFDTNGLVIFTANDGTLFSEVYYAECCPRRTEPVYELVDNGIDENGFILTSTIIRCRNTRNSGGGGDGEDCRYLESITAIPNPSGGLTQITVSGKYCNGDDFSFNFVNGYGGQFHTQETVNACVVPSSITIYPIAPQRVSYVWDDSESCGQFILNPPLLALRSNIGQTSFNTNLCNPATTPLTQQIKIESAVFMVINVGDKVYNAGVNGTLFNGQNKWYRLAFSIVDTDEDFVVGKVNNNGVITEIRNC